MNPATATLEQIAEAVNRTHDCVHATGQKLGGKIDRLAETVRKDRHSGANRDQTMDVRIARIEGALGVDPKRVKQKRTLAGMKPWQAILAVVGAMGGVQVAYQWLLPALWKALVAFHLQALG